jgi:hypothetical protein
VAASTHARITLTTRSGKNWREMTPPLPQFVPKNRRSPMRINVYSQELTAEVAAHLREMVK